MGFARRWIMKGPWQHPNGVWYYRGELPKDLWDARDKLAALGVRLGSGKELRRSLGTRDRKVAQVRLAEVVTELNAQWASYRDALLEGPIELSERNVAAIAGERSRRYLKAHEDNPSLGAVPPERPVPALSAQVMEAVGRLNAKDEARLRDVLTKVLSDAEKLSAEALSAKLVEWDDDPLLSIISRSIVEPLATTLSREHSADINRVLKERSVIASSKSRAALLVAAAQFQAKARRSLGIMATTGDYRSPEWTEGLPEYRAPAKAHSFEGIITAEAKRRSLGKDARPLPDRTITSFKAVCAKFARFRGRGGTNAATVTADELDKWKADLLSKGEVSNRTIANHVGTIKTVLRWARGLYRGDFARVVSELDQVALPGFTPKPSDLSAIHPDEALVILKAARNEADPRLRWLPWICAYTGLRIAEACQLQTTDFFESEGHWFFDVSTSGKRSLKSANARRTIPIHRALIGEGFLTFVTSLKVGPIFARGASSAVTRWFHTIGGMHDGVSPNHGWRHLFKDLCRRYELSDDARHYLTGHSTGGADQEYGRTRAMLPGLWRQMERITPFKV